MGKPFVKVIKDVIVQGDAVKSMAEWPEVQKLNKRLKVDGNEVALVTYFTGAITKRGPPEGFVHEQNYGHEIYFSSLPVYNSLKKHFVTHQPFTDFSEILEYLVLHGELEEQFLKQGFFPSQGSP